jgi:hypothetical protein
MPNWWEQRYGLTFSGGLGGTGDNGPDGDPDGDGVRNFDEWVAETNPRDAASLFAIVNRVYAAGPGEFTLNFRSSSIRTYSLEFTADLNQAFAPVQTVNGTGGVITLAHTAGTAGGYYRVQVEVPVL